MRVELDKQSLFALASDTRLDILKSLQPMRRTVTQLSETLSIDKAAIHRHLKKLEEGGLVKRYEEHGFVYYGLSWKARDLMSPNENTKIIVLLSSTWLIIMIAAFLLLASTGTVDFQKFATGGPTGGTGDMDYNGMEALSGLPWAVYAGPAIALCIVAVTFAMIGSKSLVRPKQKNPEKAVESTVTRLTDD